MKINDVISENYITSEAPVGVIQQQARKIGSRVLNKLPGGKAKAQNLAGKADLGDTVSILYNEFNNYVGTQDRSINQATGEDLIAYLKSKRLAPENMPQIPGGVLQKNQLNTILMQVAKDAMARNTASKGVQPTAGQDIDGDGKPDQTDNAKIIASLPADLQNTLKNLSTEQRQELLRLL